MPVLFGNSYILPAIIVVVLLLLLLLVLVLRSRSLAGKSPKAVTPPPGRPAPSPPRTVRGDRQPVGVAPPGPSAAGAASAYYPPSEAAAGVQDAPAGAATQLPPQRSAEPLLQPQVAAPAGARMYTPEGQTIPLPASDPLHAVILDLLAGWADLTDQDTKRLSMFKPDKVLAAVQSIEIPKELKSSRHAHTRLAQLRRYALDSVEEQKSSPARSTDEEGAATEPLEETKPTPHEEPVLPAGEPVLLHEEPVLPAAEPDTLPDGEAWVEPDLETFRDISLEHGEGLPAEEDRFVAAEDRFAEEVEEEPLPAVTDADEWATPLPGESRPVAGGFAGNIDTADGLLALPPHEQVEMVRFLRPEELSRVFERTGDNDVKKAVIDTLEHVSSPASLEVLRRCLDDPDPEIQLHALEAADRLLGVD